MRIIIFANFDRDFMWSLHNIKCSIYSINTPLWGHTHRTGFYQFYDVNMARQVNSIFFLSFFFAFVAVIALYLHDFETKSSSHNTHKHTYRNTRELYKTNGKEEHAQTSEFHMRIKAINELKTSPCFHLASRMASSSRYDSKL